MLDFVHCRIENNVKLCTPCGFVQCRNLYIGVLSRLRKKPKDLVEGHSSFAVQQSSVFQSLCFVFRCHVLVFDKYVYRVSFCIVYISLS